ncbi:hypothetical protein LCGC14_2106440 [marine sediment metagenome]|uniref:Uncharacterized protein n=1 Tax=marine sediment metagenome TaxID=412755 RepID=A0A0F9E8E2_9ZZZZ
MLKRRRGEKYHLERGTTYTVVRSIVHNGEIISSTQAKIKLRHQPKRAFIAKD